MHHSSSRQTDMNKENVPVANYQCAPARVTRARAKALGASWVLPPLHPVTKQDHKHTLQPKTKRTSSDNNKSATDVAPIVQSKRRAVLKEITNNPFNHSSIKVTHGIKIQISNEVKRCTSKKNDRVVVAPSVSVDPQGKTTEASNDESIIIDIDSKHKGPQMCSLYSTEVYNNLRTAELKWRHSVDFMKTVQQEITQEMRSILIDWLVEVGEEYGLASETFYLTVALIDHYLSKKSIGKRRLQLLGITCMLIASKYEEISAPRVEEFCFITDSTYTKVENGTLEHYTCYKESELQVTVLALQDLQLNNAAPLHVIRQKYQQHKYKSVATLTSRKPVKLLL
ncbi:hypothetical protein L1887_29686 [Cichorium endivia]|nr:hypothetical protein L1887_29686 [Cichorium endivia]